MNGAGLASGLQLFVAVPLALVFAAFVVRSGAARGGARALLSMLLLEAAGQGMFGLVRRVQGDASLVLAGLGVTLFAWATFTYVLLLRTLETPATRPIRSRLGVALAAIVVGGPATLNFALGMVAFPLPDLRTSIVPGASSAGFVASLFASILVGIYAFVASVDALRRRPGSSTNRARARFFVAAFATRDAVLLTAIALGTSAGAANPLLADLALPLWPLAPILFIPLIAYGVLVAQLFDIELKLKWTLRRGTLATVFIAVCAAVASAITEWLGQTRGILAGAAAAGFLIFLLAPLQRFADGVAARAMPDVQDSAAYREFRKLEVYRGALDGPARSGVITEADRHMLDRLRSGLGITAADAHLLERDVMRAGGR